MRVLGNPVLLRAMVGLVCATFAFLLGLLLIRAMRRKISAELDISEEAPSLESLPLHLYNTVIQQLKQQKHELQVQSQAEQQRAKTSETFSQAVVANLSSGVLVFGANGLVKSANPAAKAILGFASATGMGMKDIFRGAVVCSGQRATTGKGAAVAEEIEAVLREGSKRRELHAEYETPAGEMRFISMTVSPVPAADGSLLGVACLLNDLSELERMRQQQEIQREISVEMALQLSASLSTICAYAHQLAGKNDRHQAEQLAKDIARETAQLNQTVGGFLTSAHSNAAAAVSR